MAVYGQCFLETSMFRYRVAVPILYRALTAPHKSTITECGAQCDLKAVIELC